MQPTSTTTAVSSARRARVFLGILALLAGVRGGILEISAQILPRAVLSAATTLPAQADGSAWVLLVCLPADPAVVAGRRWAVYGKAGGPESSAPFSRLGFMTPGGPPPNLAALAVTAASMGEDLDRLGALLDAVAPTNTVRSAPNAAAKLAVVLDLARNRPPLAQALEFTASQSYLVQLALGRAWAARMGAGPVTFEVRDYDPANSRDLFVTARLSLNAGSPVPLPAPSAPLAAGNAAQGGHLTVGLLWAESEALRRRSILVQGYDVWRMPAARARQLGLDGRAPTAAELQAHAVQASRTLVTPAARYLNSQVGAASAQLENALFTDSGPENPAWRDGDEFAWFVVPRDRLGQSGEASRAGFGFVCDKRPPPPPGGLEIENVFEKKPGGSTRQLLRLRWPLGADGKGQQATRYHLYRGQGILPAVAIGDPPASQRLAVLDLPPGASRGEWLDLSLDAAANPALFGQAFWYALRAERSTPCGPVVSDLAPAVTASLHRLDAPAPPSGSLLIRCPGIQVVSKPPAAFEPVREPTPNEHHYAIAVERQDRGVAWAEITVRVAGTAFETHSPQLRFGEDDDTVRFEVSIPASLAPTPQIGATVVTGGFSSAVSSPAEVLFQGAPPAGQQRMESFQTGTFVGEETLADRAPQCPHIAFPPGSANVNPVRLRLQLTPRTRQWRVFRQLDDAPLSLIAEGLGEYQAGASNLVIATDDAMPHEGARLCYYGQVADENANWSSLALIGCLNVPPRALPVPLLGPPSAEGTLASPILRLKWFCPPGGVRDFVILLKPVAGPLPAQATNSVQIAPQKKATAWGGAAAATAQPASLLLPVSYVTASIGTNPPTIGSGPDFSIPLAVDPGVTYEVRVAARDARGSVGHPSWMQRFTWKTPRNRSDRDVPWPDRPLPPVLSIDPRLQAALLLNRSNLVWPISSNRAPVGVLIGSVPVSDYDLNQPLTQLYTRSPLGGVLFFPAAQLALGFEPWLFGDSLSSPPRPQFKPLEVVLYRQQQTNGLHPRVSGRAVQTSPLFRKVAGRPVGPNGADGYELLDPFVATVIRVAGPNEPGPRGWIDLYLLDTHPVVRGARYRYWLMHFGANGEPDQTIPAGEIEVTP